MYHNIAAELDSGAWAEIVPAKCPCRGGWLLSDYDTWHRCPIHGNGVPHPEDEGADFDYVGHNIRIHRAAWRALQERSGLDPKAFRSAVEDEITIRVRTEPFVASPENFVALAEKVSDELVNEALDRKARAAGYGSRLEAALTESGIAEAEARRAGHSDPEQYGLDQSREWYP